MIKKGIAIIFLIIANALVLIEYIDNHQMDPNYHASIMMMFLVTAVGAFIPMAYLFWINRKVTDNGWVILNAIGWGVIVAGICLLATNLTLIF